MADLVRGEDYRQGLYFEEMEEGDTFDFGGRTISEGELGAYLSLVPNIAEGHTNDDKMDGKRVVHGLITLLVSHGVTMYDGTPHRRPGGGFYGIDGIRFTNPVYFGDTIYCEAEVAKKEVYNDEIGKVTYDRRVTNQDGDLVLVYSPIVLVARKPQDE